MGAGARKERMRNMRREDGLSRSTLVSQARATLTG